MTGHESESRVNSIPGIDGCHGGACAVTVPEAPDLRSSIPDPPQFRNLRKTGDQLDERNSTLSQNIVKARLGFQEIRGYFSQLKSLVSQICFGVMVLPLS